MNESKIKALESHYHSLKEKADNLKQAKNDEFTNLTGIRVEVCKFKYYFKVTNTSQHKYIERTFSKDLLTWVYKLL